MQQAFRVESRSYDGMLRGMWQAYQLESTMRLSDEQVPDVSGDCIRLWLPAGTVMRWTRGARPLQYNCVQYFWPGRWYMLSAFYNALELRHTYASVIEPPTIALDGLTYVDLDLSMLVHPNMSYEVLTQAEFDQMADILSYSEETQREALTALRLLTSSAQLGVGLFATIPHTLRHADFHLSRCSS